MPTIEDGEFTESERDAALAELVSNTAPLYDPERDLLKDDIAKAVGMHPKSVTSWVERMPEWEVYKVRKGGHLVNAFRRKTSDGV